MDNIQNINNTNSIVWGSVKAKYFGGVKYEIAVDSIEMENKETTITKLKDICSKKNY